MRQGSYILVCAQMAHTLIEHSEHVVQLFQVDQVRLLLVIENTTDFVIDDLETSEYVHSR